MTAIRSTSIVAPLFAALVSLCACAEPEISLPAELRADQPHGVAASVSGLSASGFNAYVLDAIGKFGGASYLWKGDGVKRTITYRGSVVAKPYQANVCHCVGATFQAYMDAFEEWTRKNRGDGTIKGMSVSQLKAFRQVWYVASGGTEGSKAALTKYNLGTAVSNLSAAQPGDFVQIWRNSGSGHSVIFSSWKRTNGAITGLTYWSCNNGGPGYLTETIGSGSRDITPGKIHIGHPLEPGTPLKPDAGTKPDTRPSQDASAPKNDVSAPRKDSAAVQKDRGVEVKPDRRPPQKDSGNIPTMAPMQLEGGCSLASCPSPANLPWSLLVLALVRRNRRRSQKQ